MQIHQTFLDRCIELLVDHKLTSESASMIKYSATDMCGNVVDECCSYLAVMGICGIIQLPECMPIIIVARIYGN
jgi:acyl-CoA dehydrogenase